MAREKKAPTLVKDAATYRHPEADLAAATELKALSKPFLNWTGKAERLSFEVPTLPLFVHERLSTKVILETLGGHKRDKQLDLLDALFGASERGPCAERGDSVRSRPRKGIRDAPNGLPNGRAADRRGRLAEDHRSLEGGHDQRRIQIDAWAEKTPASARIAVSVGTLSYQAFRSHH